MSTLEATRSSFDETMPSFEGNRQSIEESTRSLDETTPSLEEATPSIGETSLSRVETMPSMDESLPYLEDRKQANIKVRLNIYKRILQFNLENDTIFRHGLTKGWIMEDMEEVIEDLINAIENKKNAITSLENERDGATRVDEETKQRIYQLILKCSTQNPTVFKRSLNKKWVVEDVEEVLEDLIWAIENNKEVIKSLRTEKEDELAKLQSQHAIILETTKTSLREAHSFNLLEQQKTLNEERSKLKEEVSTLRQAAGKMEIDQQKRDIEAKNSHEKELQELEGRYKKLLGKMQQELTAASKRNEHLVTAHTNKIVEMQTKCDNQVKDAQREGKDNVKECEDFYKGRLREEEDKANDLCRLHAKEKTQLSATHTEKYNKLSGIHEAEKQIYEKRLLQAEKDAEELGQQHEYEKSELNANHLRDLDTLRDNHKIELDQRIATHTEEKEALESQLANIRQGHAHEIGQLKNAHNTTVKAMRQEHEKEKYQLFIGDSFRSISDGDLANDFRDLVDDIEHFARVPWSQSLAKTWPIPIEAFSGSTNEQENQQFLFQNTIWTILYERVFCNPFQVLGDEGVRLQQQWLTKFGGQGEIVPQLVPT